MTTPTAERVLAGRAFWLQWVLASAVGFGLNAASLAALSALFDKVGLGLGLVAGALAFGASHWLVLRHRVAQAGWWVGTPLAGIVAGVASAALLGAVVNIVSGAPMPFAIEMLLSFALGGAVAGLLQWRLLRRHVRRAGWWIVASSLGWLVIVGASGSLAFTLGVGEAMLGRGVLFYTAVVGIIGAAGGAAYGATTGAVLAWLARRPELRSKPTTATARQ